jgi:hypothetical protein
MLRPTSPVRSRMHDVSSMLGLSTNSLCLTMLCGWYTAGDAARRALVVRRDVLFLFFFIFFLLFVLSVFLILSLACVRRRCAVWFASISCYFVCFTLIVQQNIRNINIQMAKPKQTRSASPRRPRSRARRKLPATPSTAAVAAVLPKTPVPVAITMQTAVLAKSSAAQLYLDSCAKDGTPFDANRFNALVSAQERLDAGSRGFGGVVLLQFRIMLERTMAHIGPAFFSRVFWYFMQKCFGDLLNAAAITNNTVVAVDDGSIKFILDPSSPIAADDSNLAGKRIMLELGDGRVLVGTFSTAKPYSKPTPIISAAASRTLATQRRRANRKLQRKKPVVNMNALATALGVFARNPRSFDNTRVCYVCFKQTEEAVRVGRNLKCPQCQCFVRA